MLCFVIVRRNEFFFIISREWGRILKFKLMLSFDRYGFDFILNLLLGSFWDRINLIFGGENFRHSVSARFRGRLIFSFLCFKIKVDCYIGTSLGCFIFKSNAPFLILFRKFGLLLFHVKQNILCDSIWRSLRH